jgi:hypothetical protein
MKSGSFLRKSRINRLRNGLAQALGSTAREFCFAAAFAERRRRACRQPPLAWLGGATQQINQPLVGVLAIALLRAEPMRHNDEITVRGHPPPGNRAQPRAHFFVEARRARGIKSGAGPPWPLY